MPREELRFSRFSKDQNIIWENMEVATPYSYAEVLALVPGAVHDADIYDAVVGMMQYGLVTSNDGAPDPTVLTNWAFTRAEDPDPVDPDEDGVPAYPDPVPPVERQGNTPYAE